MTCPFVKTDPKPFFQVMLPKLGHCVGYYIFLLIFNKHIIPSSDLSLTKASMYVQPNAPTLICNISSRFNKKSLAKAKVRMLTCWLRAYFGEYLPKITYPIWNSYTSTPLGAKYTRLVSPESWHFEFFQIWWWKQYEWMNESLFV